MSKNCIGLDKVAVAPTAEKLGVVLANYHIYYANLRGLHWNIVGDKFFELHELYEEYYDEVADKIDEIAERIVMLGFTPANSFTQYLQQATIKELTAVSDWEVGVKNVLQTMKDLAVGLREVLSLAQEGKDIGTVSLVRKHIESFEKKIWMLSVYLTE